MDSADYEVISAKPFWLFTHSNRTALSALFYSQWSDCCCIYSWPVINASSGRLVITNGSRSTESPLWSPETLTRGVLSWQDRSTRRVFIFIYLFIWGVCRRKKRTINLPLSPLAYLLMIGWRRCAVPGVRLFRIIWGKLLCFNWALKKTGEKLFHHWFWYCDRGAQKGLHRENKHDGEDRRSPQQWPTVWNSSWNLVIINYPLIIHLLWYSAEQWAGRTPQKRWLFCTAKFL